MAFLSLLRVASMPVVQMLIISILGAFMATDYLNLLPSDARMYLNKIAYAVFAPSLIFSSLAKTVTLQDIISWWFMPVNIGITFAIGGSFGWIAVKILSPEPYLQDLIIAMCSAGNLGNIMLIIVPAICKENGSPFGDKNVCNEAALSYVSFSMALGAFYIWTHTFHLIRRASVKYKAQHAADQLSTKEPNNDPEANHKSLLLHNADHVDGNSIQKITKEKSVVPFELWKRIMEILHQLREELMTPPILAAIIGFLFGAITWLRNLIIGENAPLKVINDSLKLLGDGTIPSVTLILGGNLTKGLRRAKVEPKMIIAVICVRYILLPIIGIAVVKAALHFGFIPSDPLYQLVLMIQFTLPPAMSIGTMTQLFDVAQEECSVFFLWTYLAAAVALTCWSTVFMWILS